MTDQNDNSLRALREIVHADPALQEQLFRLQDAAAFIGEVQRLAESRGLELDEENIRQAMRTAKMGWLERRLP